MSAVVEGRRKGLFRRGSASTDAPIAPEKGKKSNKKSGKRRGKEKPIGLPQVNLLPAEISDAIKVWDNVQNTVRERERERPPPRSASGGKHLDMTFITPSLLGVSSICFHSYGSRGK